MTDTTRRGFLGVIAGIGTAAFVPFKVIAHPEPLHTVGKKTVDEYLGRQFTINGKSYPLLTADAHYENLVERPLGELGSKYPEPPRLGRKIARATVEFLPTGDFELIDAGTDVEVVIPSYFTDQEKITYRLTGIVEQSEIKFDTPNHQIVCRLDIWADKSSIDLEE